VGVHLTRVDDILEVKIEGRWSDIADAKDKVKEIPGRRWNPDKKVWVLPADPELADQILKTLRPEADEELMAWLKQSMVDTEESLTSPLPEDDEVLIPWGNRRCAWQPEYINDEEFTGALPYQRSAIRHLADLGRALLADDMGLGKTFMLISAVEEFRLRNKMADNVTMPEGPRLVVAPASVLGGWNRELHRWLKDPRVQLVDGKTPKKRHEQIQEAIKHDAWTIVNWEQLRVKRIEVTNRKGAKRKLYVMKEPLFEFPQAYGWDLNLEDWDAAAYGRATRQFSGQDPYWLATLADEIHRAKNKDSQQTKGLHRIKGQFMAGATGTPIMNSPDELWSLLRWLWPDQYHERGDAHSDGALAYWPFYNLYVKYYEDHFGRKTVTGVKNPDALRFALKGKVIRRTASILGLQGRKRIFFDVPLNPGQQKLYEEAEKSMWLAVEADVSAGNKDAIEFAKKAAEGGSIVELMRIPNGAARFVRLQQIIENAALLGGADDSALMDDFEEKYSDSQPNQWIVFCKYKETCELLAERMRKKFGARVAVYNGDVPSARRTEIEDEYQRGELDVVIGTIDAMYQGITLTSGHMQYWMSRDVVPAKNEQGEARQDRLGQQKLVIVYIPQATNTVAINKVHVINRLKEGIVKVVIPKDTIEEESR
jgi:SNF2 family DNA or RNA helicase